MSIWQILLDSIVVFSFMLLNGFFVATEYAIVKVRSTQIEPLAKRGNLRAKIAREILVHTNAYISATQLGVTMTSLALGWIGEPLVATILEPFFLWIGVAQSAMSHAISFALAFSIITSIHIIVGEQAPKVFAIQNSTSAILTAAYPIRLFYFLFRPIVLTLNAASNGLLHLIGLRSTTDSEVVHSEEELRFILAHDQHITPVSREIALKAMDFHQKQARHAMIPRKEIVALSADASVQTNLTVMMGNKFSRFPVFKDTIDNIVGRVSDQHVVKFIAGTVDRISTCQG